MAGEIKNPLKGITRYGWHFEQNVYLVDGVTRALKAGGGSGNIPKVITYESDIVGRLQPEGCERRCAGDGDDPMGQSRPAAWMEDNRGL